MNKLKIKVSLLLLSLVLLITIGAVSAEQSSIYVATDGNDEWSGESSTWNGTDGPKLTIKNALSTVSINGTVNVASGTYYEKEIAILDHVQLTGTGSTSTIIDAQGTEALFYVDESVEALISGFTLRNGNFIVGGAIYNRGNLEVTDVTFESNNALDSGGAIYNSRDGELTVTGCNFTENTARNGGAIYNYGTATVSNSIFTQNTATQGGAITNYSPVTITGSIFNLNQAIEMGGALYNSPTGEVIIINSTFDENTATDTVSFGGAMASYGALIITESILTSNQAAYGGSVANTGKLSAIATGNWWGNTNGPEEGMVYGDVDSSNWITSDPNSEPETNEPVNTSNLENMENLENSESQLEPITTEMTTEEPNIETETENNTETDVNQTSPTTTDEIIETTEETIEITTIPEETPNEIITTEESTINTEPYNTQSPDEQNTLSTTTEGDNTTDQTLTTTDQNPIDDNSMPLASLTWGCLMIVGGVVLPRRK